MEITGLIYRILREYLPAAVKDYEALYKETLRVYFSDIGLLEDEMETYTKEWISGELDARLPLNIGASHKGLAQGANTSPILTAAALKEFVNQEEDSVFYADDGIFFSNNPIFIQEDPETGIYLNKEKCHTIKENGK